MPQQKQQTILRLCAEPGCGQLVARGRCARHTHRAEPRDCRESASARGYDTTWQRCRKMFLARNPVCADCGRGLLDQKGRGHVHHIQKLADRPDLRLDMNNLMALCNSCHAARTARGE